jgi:hypothetical protein
MRWILEAFCCSWTEGRKLVFKQKTEGAAIKNRKGSSWGRWVYIEG